MRIELKRFNHALHPASEKASDYIDSWPDHEVRVVDVKKMRNPKHHRKAFAILNFALQNQEIYPSVDALLQAVKILCGHIEQIRIKISIDKENPYNNMGKETVYYVTKSISFGSMDQVAFGEFYPRMIEALTEITGIPADILEQGSEQ